MTTADVIVSIAQIAAGGTIVQAVVAVLRRRSELRQLDRQSESLAVETADRLVGMLRAEMLAAHEQIAALRTERTALLRQIDDLTARPGVSQKT
ncbi:hypothetical protein [Actinomadura flavalba]|uniref:hypothetical protein n=1 Tax=Actinomadura flavalba TaxID=1120938 RepID=UPI00035F0B50|nr:hypothetical protein [Actinomadura flavalba]